MGMYLEIPGEDTGKAERLLTEYGAERFEGESFADVPADKVLVCVAENKAGGEGISLLSLNDLLTGSSGISFPQENTFDAIAVVYDQAEYDHAKGDDHRTLHWLLLDIETAIPLEPKGDLATFLGRQS